MAQLVKNLPTMQEARVQYLGQEDPLKKEMATHSSIPSWEILFFRATVHGLIRVRQDLATKSTAK